MPRRLQTWPAKTTTLKQYRLVHVHVDQIADCVILDSITSQPCSRYKRTQFSCCTALCIVMGIFWFWSHSWFPGLPIVTSPSLWCLCIWPLTLSFCLMIWICLKALILLCFTCTCSQTCISETLSLKPLRLLLQLMWYYCVCLCVYLHSVSQYASPSLLLVPVFHLCSMHLVHVIFDLVSRRSTISSPCLLHVHHIWL